MPNIVITSYCNLHCPYCFAQDMMKEQQMKNISIERFDEILEWIRPYAEENRCRIGIFGGEPTLHPEFETIMEHTSAFCQKYNAWTILFTNGICLTPNIIKTIPDKMGILINCNHPSGYQEKDLNQFHNNLDFLYSIGWLGDHTQRISLGMTICEDIDDLSFYYNLLKKYNHNRIRLAVDMSKEKIYSKEYNMKMKNKFLEVMDFCSKEEIYNIGLDCHIPLQFFTKEEQERIFQVIPKEKYIAPCYPEYEIFPNLTMTGCFTHYQNIDCTQYKNYKDFRSLNPTKAGNNYE